jgi:hypothetical protein
MNYAAMIAQLGLTEQQTRALMQILADIQRETADIKARLTAGGL